MNFQTNTDSPSMASFMDLTEEQKQRRREQKRAEALARKYALKAATLSAQSSSPPLPCHTCGADRLAGGRGRRGKGGRGRGRRIGQYWAEVRRASNNVSSSPSRCPRGGWAEGACALVTGARFLLNIRYHPQVLAIVRTVPSAEFHVARRRWTFHIRDHDILIHKLACLKPYVEVTPLPAFILQTSREPLDLNPGEVDLPTIDIKTEEGTEVTMIDFKEEKMDIKEEIKEAIKEMKEEYIEYDENLPTFEIVKKEEKDQKDANFNVTLISEERIQYVVEFPCPECDRSFNLRIKLNRHLKKHASQTNAESLSDL